jgi:hypothetical protein
MRYRLRTLLIALAVAPPLLGWFWFNREWFIVACGVSVVAAFFMLWYLMVRKSESLGPGARGSPRINLPAYKEFD